MLNIVNRLFDSCPIPDIQLDETAVGSAPTDAGFDPPAGLFIHITNDYPCALVGKTPGRYRPDPFAAPVMIAVFPWSLIHFNY